jgi:hypothetical protein
MCMTMQSQSETSLAARPNRAADDHAQAIVPSDPLAAEPSQALEPRSAVWPSIDRALMVAIA